MSTFIADRIEVFKNGETAVIYPQGSGWVYAVPTDLWDAVPVGGPGGSSISQFNRVILYSGSTPFLVLEPSDLNTQHNSVVWIKNQVLNITLYVRLPIGPRDGTVVDGFDLTAVNLNMKAVAGLPRVTATTVTIVSKQIGAEYPDKKTKSGGWTLAELPQAFQGNFQSLLDAEEAAGIVSTAEAMAAFGTGNVPALGRIEYLLVAVKHVSDNGEDSSDLYTLELRRDISGVGAKTPFYDGSRMIASASGFQLFQRTPFSWLPGDAHSSFGDLTVGLRNVGVDSSYWNDLIVTPSLLSDQGGTDGTSISFLPSFDSQKFYWNVALLLRQDDQTKFSGKEEFIYVLAGISAPLLASFPKFLCHDGRPLTLQAVTPINAVGVIDNKITHATKDEEWPDSNLFPQIWMQLKAQSLPLTVESKVRLGALDLEVFGEATLTLQLRYAIPATSGKKRIRETRRFPRIHIDGTIELISTSPGGQDPPPGEMSSSVGSAPLVLQIPDDRNGITVPVPQMLAITEQFLEPSRHNVSLNLTINDRDFVPTGLASRQLVLDANPFAVVQIISPDLVQSVRSNRSNEVGNWSNQSVDGQKWELAGTTDGFQILLPPQVVGEQAARAKEEGSDTALLDFRYSPPARFNIYPTFFKQKFSEAPWNLRRILGYPGQRAPGAAVIDGSFEFLYGMTGLLSAQGLRLAEIGSRIGDIVPCVQDKLAWNIVPSDASDDLKTYKALWDSTRRVYQSRVSVLELYQEQSDAELNLTDGIVFYLRDSAKLKHPISPNSQDDGFKPDGLAGGWSWPFESQNMLTAVLRNRNSDVAALFEPRFSAVGGWARQKAAFDEGRTSIQSETAMGSVNHIALERIGRIGTIWNRAKYVVVYERSVVAPRQFEDEQYPHRGQPILRKVREYVEITQVKRPYPEFVGQPDILPGCVTGSFFQTTIIPVDGAWGTDLGTDGWIVPLWNPNADPQLHPKPLICLEMSGEKATGDSTPLYVIDEPEKLVFYTNTAPGLGADTDLWPSVLVVDFEDLPHPRPLNELPLNPRPLAESPFDPRTPDGMLPDANSVASGYDNHTFAVRRLGGRANIVAGRSKTSTLVELYNVTLSRGTPFGDDVALNKLGQVNFNKFFGTFQWVDGASSVLGRALQVLPWESQAHFTPQPTTQDTPSPNLPQRQLDAVAKSILAGQTSEIAHCVSPPNVDQSTGWVLPSLDVWAKATVDSWKSQAVQSLATIGKRLADLADFAFPIDERGFDQQKQVILNMVSRIDSGRSIIEKAVGKIEEATSAAVAAIQVSLLNIVDQMEELENTPAGRTELRSILSTILDAADGSMARLDVMVAQAGNDAFPGIALQLCDWIGELRDAVDMVLLAAINALDKFEDPDPTVPQMADAAFFGLIVDVEELTYNTLSDLQEYVDGIFDDIGDQLQTIDETISATLGKEIHDIEDLLKSLTHDTLDTVRNQIEGKTADLVKVFDDYKAGFLTQLQSLGAEPADWFEQASHLLNEDALNVLIGDPNSTVEDVRRALERARRVALPLAETAATVVRDAILSVHAGELLFQEAGNGMRLIRAFAESPTAEGLTFTRDRIAYLFQEGSNIVKTTPLAALGNRVGNALKGVSLRVPMSGVCDGLIPESLQSFDISKILPDFCGLKLDGIFPGGRLPSLANDRIKITHGFDSQRMRAWGQADIDVPITDALTIFSLGPISFQLLRCRFKATQRIAAGVGLSAEQSNSGSIRGDWDLLLNGSTLVRFQDTALTFSNGSINFELRPDQVKPQGLLMFLTDLMSSAPSSNSGLTTKILQSFGIPAGVECRLDIGLPPLSFGAFGLRNLNLLALLELNIDLFPFDFSIAATLGIADRFKPFNLSILFLAGGGWFDINAKYRPLKRELVSNLDVGIAVGAQMAIALGPIEGSVSVFFGIQVSFETGGNHDVFSFLASLILRGEVHVFGFISVCIMVGLEIEYRSGGTLIGRGYISITVKICWCFTLEFSAGFETTFAGHSQSSLAPPQPAALVLARSLASDFQTMGLAANAILPLMTSLEDLTMSNVPQAAAQAYVLSTV